MLPLVLHGDCTANNSLAVVLRNLLIAFNRLGIEVSWHHEPNYSDHHFAYNGAVRDLYAIPSYDHIGLSIGDQLKERTKNVKAYYTIDCSDSFRHLYPRDVPERYSSNYLDGLFVYSDICKQAYINSDVNESKIHNIVLGVDHNIYTPHGPKMNILEKKLKWVGRGNVPSRKSKPFIFLVAGYLQHRKGDVEVVKAYQGAFRRHDNVLLVIKTTSSHWGRNNSKQLDKMVGVDKHHPAIAYWDEDISAFEFASLLRTADCYVSPHRMEGFGLIQLEALSCGSELIVTNYHGPKQYANNGNAHLLPITGEIDAVDKTIPPGVKWADYDLRILSSLMKNVFTQRVKKNNTDYKEFSWENTAKQILDVLPPLKKKKVSRKKKNVTICMPNYNTFSHVKKCVESIKDVTNHNNYKIVVYDDCSSDREDIKGLKGVTHILGDSRIGCNAGRKVMFDVIERGYVVSIDGDIDFSKTSPDWVEKMIEEYESRDCCILHPLLLYPDGRIQSAGGWIKYDKRPPHVWGVHRFDESLRYFCDSESVAEVAYCCGAFQFFHSNMLNYGKQHSDFYPAYFGDVDFCYNLKVGSGKPVIYSPVISVIHNQGSYTNTNKLEQNLNGCARLFYERWKELVEHENRIVNPNGEIRVIEHVD